MPVEVNLRHLARGPQHIEGDLPIEEFATDFCDSLVRFSGPLKYSLDVTQQGKELLVQGTLGAVLVCNCSRCLNDFEKPLQIDDFTALAPLEGEEAVAREGDIADLTALVREDTLLALPTKPLCKLDCSGLVDSSTAPASRPEAPSDPPSPSSPWGALDQLRF